ncbi:hypothetical protein IP90_02067 [Luteimonas cucumeris]|uniref:Uncharacterized protein n=1 Tax=Luteimonas cucumeris TaxID=985012 RepID=A0A562L5U0_9GAMM|nr:hypothetical protein IP90_02067 [Luteimonas cucumeris]
MDRGILAARCSTTATCDSASNRASTDSKYPSYLRFATEGMLLSRTKPTRRQSRGIAFATAPARKPLAPVIRIVVRINCTSAAKSGKNTRSARRQAFVCLLERQLEAAVGTDNALSSLNSSVMNRFTGHRVGSIYFYALPFEERRKEMTAKGGLPDIQVKPRSQVAGAIPASSMLLGLERKDFRCRVDRRGWFSGAPRFGQSVRLRVRRHTDSARWTFADRSIRPPAVGLSRPRSRPRRCPPAARRRPVSLRGVR